MTEVAGLSIGVLALAGLFNNAVDCFEYVQLGRAFGKDFQTSQLKLDNARLRLSRWGKSLRLGDEIQDTVSLKMHFGPEATEGDIKHAEELLGQIMELFADAEGISNKYKSRATPEDASLAVYNPQTDLARFETLHLRMKELALQRQNRNGARHKAKWALYQEKQFRRLIEDINELVSSLVELFPASLDTQRALCDEEVSKIEKAEGVEVLKDIAAEQDKFLEEALVKAAKNASGTHHIVFSGCSTGGVQVGHNSGTMSGFTFGKMGSD